MSLQDTCLSTSEIEDPVRCLAIRGPKILQNSWDRHKTVKQKCVVAPVFGLYQFTWIFNRLWAFQVCTKILIYDRFCDSYDALGLVATLKPNESGGTEHNKYGRLEGETIPSTSTRGDPKGVAMLSTGAKIPPGYGRILRDEQGNAVGIEFADVDEVDTDRKAETMEDMDHAYLDERSACTWTQLGPRTAARRTSSVVEGESEI